MKKLPREFYNRETTAVARSLLGLHLVHRSQNIERIGKIVEVEAYLGEHDFASHSSKGLTKRTAVMFSTMELLPKKVLMKHCFVRMDGMHSYGRNRHLAARLIEHDRDAPSALKLKPKQF